MLVEKARCYVRSADSVSYGVVEPSRVTKDAQHAGLHGSANAVKQR